MSKKSIHEKSREKILKTVQREINLYPKVIFGTTPGIPEAMEHIIACTDLSCKEFWSAWGPVLHVSHENIWKELRFKKQLLEIYNISGK